MVCAEFALRTRNRAISGFTARFLWLNLPVYRAHTPATGSAPSPLSAPSVRTPRACYRAASPALPAVPGCCRTHPRRRCSRWQEWCHLRIGLLPVSVHVVVARKQFVHSEPHFYVKRCLFGCPKPCQRTGVSCKIVVWTKLEIFALPMPQKIQQESR